MKISSIGGMVIWINSASYLASKGAVNRLTRSMAVDDAADNIRVNALCAGWILTTVEKKRIEQNPDTVEEVKRRTGIQRLGQPGDMAYAVLCLAYDESSNVTGTTIIGDRDWVIQ